MAIPAISHIVSPYRHLLVGFSGGLDSTVLLHRLKLWRDQELDVKLRAVHIHHGLSPNADGWARHCTKICQEWKIPLIVIRVPVTRSGLGVEAQARRVRYRTFKEILLPNEVIVVAHHLNDQCETVLLALKRGSGPAGLSAMSMKTKFSNTYLLRPLLDETRESIMFWAKRHSLCWIEDESNQNDRYDRNFLRLHVMPLLNERWLHIFTAIARSASLCAEQENLLDELLFDELATLISNKGALKIAPLVEMSAPHRAALLRRWFSKQGALMPSRSMLSRVWKEVAKSREDATPHISLNGYDIRRFQGSLWRVKSPLPCRDMTLSWNDLSKPLILPHGMGKVSLRAGGHISPPAPGETVSIRFKASGIIHIIGRHSGCKLKKIWQELNVPPWERATIPLLFYNEKLVSAVGKFIVRGMRVENGLYFNRES